MNVVLIMSAITGLTVDAWRSSESVISPWMRWSILWARYQALHVASGRPPRAIELPRRGRPTPVGA